jgi:hypothetical protein
MKTYKLIKTYPGSFPLGHLAILDESVKYYNLGTTTRSLDYIENHPENWQHVCYKCHENVYTCKSFGCKQAILITEDGVDIFEGDNYYFVNTNLDFKAYTGTIMKGMTATNPDTKKFSTKKAAENYIKMNKPCLSLDEVLEVVEDTCVITLNSTRKAVKEKLTKIVKQKLK